MAVYSPETSNRILVVRAGALGDTLMATPLIRRLHEENPRREIDVLCSVGGAAILRNNPYLSQIHPLQFRNLPHFISPEKRKLVSTLRERAYDAAILLESAQHYRDTLERANIQNIRGFTETPFDPALHSAVNNLRAGGFENCRGADLDMDLVWTASSEQWSADVLRELPKPRIGIHAGYGPNNKKQGQSERLRGWKVERFAEVARELTGMGGSVVLTGSKEDRETCEAIARDLHGQPVRMMAGETTIDQLAALIHSLDLFISVDSGPAHIAAAVGTPLVVLWGPGILAQTRPLSSSTPIRLLNADVPCAPCYGTPEMKRCERNICMEHISRGDVLDAALSLLPTGQTKPRLRVLNIRAD